MKKGHHHHQGDGSTRPASAAGEGKDDRASGLLLHHMLHAPEGEASRLMDFMLADLAVQRAQRFPVPMDHGSKVYTLARTEWASRVLGEIEDIRLVRDEAALRLAMRSVGVHYILLAHDSGIDYDMLNRICRDSGQIKTIFWVQ